MSETTSTNPAGTEMSGRGEAGRPLVGDIFEPSPALRLRTEVRPSSVPGAGVGIFALEGARAGDFLGMDFPRHEQLVSAEEELELPVERRRYSWRQIEHVCFAATRDQREAADLMNHSFDPNLLWHVGHYFALRDIEPGDELTLDYRLLLDPLWSGRLVDAGSGRPVDGTPWRRALAHSCRQLLALLASQGEAEALDP